MTATSKWQGGPKELWSRRKSGNRKSLIVLSSGNRIAWRGLWAGNTYPLGMLVVLIAV